MSDASGFPDTASAQPDPKSNLSYRSLKVVVVVLGVLIVLALMLLVYGFVRQAMSGGKSPATAASGDLPIVFTLAPGTQILAMQTSGDRLVLQVRGHDGDEVDIVDLKTGRLVGQVKAAPLAQ